MRRSISGGAHLDPVCSSWQFSTMAFIPVKWTMILHPSLFPEVFPFWLLLFQIFTRAQVLEVFLVENVTSFFVIRDEGLSLWRKRKVKPLTEVELNSSDKSLTPKERNDTKATVHHCLHGHCRQCTDLSTRNSS